MSLDIAKLKADILEHAKACVNNDEAAAGKAYDAIEAALKPVERSQGKVPDFDDWWKTIDFAARKKLLDDKDRFPMARVAYISGAAYGAQLAVKRQVGEVIAWAVIDRNGNVWNVWRTEPSRMIIAADHTVVPLCAASDFSDSEPAAWLQIGIGELHTGSTLVRLTKPERYDHTWWRFEPLFTRPSRQDSLDKKRAQEVLERWFCEELGLDMDSAESDAIVNRLAAAFTGEGGGE